MNASISNTKVEASQSKNENICNVAITHHSSRLVTQDVLVQCFFDLYMHAYCEGQL
jgi:hypothetical protein